MKVCVFCGSSLGKNPNFAKAAEELGKALAKRGDVLVYGGSRKGLMGVVSDACFSSGGEVIAVQPRFFLEQGAVTDSITSLIPTDTMSERKQKMMDLSDCFLALPGGIGTLDEISEVATEIGLGQVKGKLILLNVDHFYDSLVALLSSYKEAGFLKKDWVGWPIVCENVAEVERALDSLKEQEHA